MKTLEDYLSIDDLMLKTKEELLELKIGSEVIYDNKSEVITFKSTKNEAGDILLSDIIIKLYGNEPVLANERVYRKNYSILKWMLLNNALKRNIANRNNPNSSVKLVFGFIKSKEYIDITCTKEWYIEWLDKMVDTEDSCSDIFDTIPSNSKV